jgi:hypothetical protein
LELLSEIRTEGAIVDGATNLKQQVGAASRPAHLCDLFIRRFTRKLAVPSVSAGPTQARAMAFGVIHQPGALARQQRLPPERLVYLQRDDFHGRSACFDT